MVEECRRELGLNSVAHGEEHGKRGVGLFRRGPRRSRRARREAPVA
jgi:hypothetical protein